MRVDPVRRAHESASLDKWALFAAALIVRLVFCFAVYPQLAAQFASDGYDDIALSLVSGDGYARAGVSAAAERLPLYPLLLALCYAVFGPVAWPWQVLQAVGGAASCVLVYSLARSIAPRAAELAAAAFCVVHPTLLLYTPRPLTETLYILLLLLLVRAVCARRGALVGALLGAQLLIKSTALLHLTVLVPLSTRGALRQLARAALAAGVVLLPWVSWNLSTFGAAHLFSATGGWALYHGLYISRHVGWVTPAADLNRDAELALWDDLAARGIARDADVSRRDATAGTIARAWIVAHPAESMQLWLRNLLLTWYLGRSRASMLAHALLHFPLLIGAGWGACRLWHRSSMSRQLAVLLSALIIAYTAFHAAVQPAVRYILPAVPLAAVLAATSTPNRKENHENTK